MHTVAQLSPEKRFELLMDAACDYAIFFTDPAGSIVEWSRSAEKIIGYSEEEALRMNARVIFTAEDQGQGAPEMEMEVAAREGQANDERWHVRKDGAKFFAIGRLIALRGEEGPIVGFVKIVRDATSHKVLEQALRASDEHFRATFSQAPIGMVLSDLAGKVEQVNDTFRNLLGLTDAEIQGREIIGFTAVEDRAAAQAMLQDLLSGKRTSVTLDKRMVRADGTYLWVRNSAAILRDTEGRPLSFIDLMQDISLLKLSEADMGRAVDERTSALREKTKQLESFCYTVAHDLRAPLRAIAGYAEFLRDDFAGQLPAEAHDYLRRIEAAAGRLDCLITDLLGYTRVQLVTVQHDELDLTAIVSRAAEQVKHDHPETAVRIEVHGPLGIVRSDATTLEHVFLNLLANAVKFRREGIAPEIHVRSETRGERLRVWVEDNGIGIDPRFKDRVFGMFERLHPQRRTPGTGVGLAIVSTAMERLGGDRGVEPNEPTGSRFWIELPRQGGSAASAGQAAN